VRRSAVRCQDTDGQPSDFNGSGLWSVASEQNDDNADGKQSSSDACDKCGAVGVEKVSLLRCSGCKKRTYCGVKCQMAAWSYHKTACKTSKKKAYMVVSSILEATVRWRGIPVEASAFTASLRRRRLIHGVQR
jgi:hypothetical protein